MENDKKVQKKMLKEAKKAEKLAKLKKKEEMLKKEKEARNAKMIENGKRKDLKKATVGFDSGSVEYKWSLFWKKNEVFKAGTGRGSNKESYNKNNFIDQTNNEGKDSVNIEEKQQFSIILPPPNITGSLHIGHAMMIAIEDSIVRFRRLNGYDVLYLPGLDHAGIATQNVVMRSVGPVGREEFLSAAYSWAEKYSDRIIEQMDRMGASLDYSRKRFTLDASASRAVNVAFKRLYEKGLIYREKKIVNWCGKLGTTVSDLEVVYKDIKGGTEIEIDGEKTMFGVMYYIKYDLVRKSENSLSNKNESLNDNSPYVIIGTTRPETILGDVAICINPNDKRFIDTDNIFSGNCHSINDFQSNITTENKIDLGSANVDYSLEMKIEKKAKYKAKAKSSRSEKNVYENKSNVNEREADFMAVNPLTGKLLSVIFDEEADINFGSGVLKVTPFHDATDFKLGNKHGLPFVRIFDKKNKIVIEGKYFGMGRFAARRAVINDLQASGRLLGQEYCDQVLPFCSRSNDIIEPIVLDQWWMKCDSMAKRALEAVQNGEIEMYPREAQKSWERWLSNINDWCLSRQLWWGHRIPAWHAIGNGKHEWIVADNYENAKEDAEKRGLEIIGQDEDVLDTWFSSGLWPFSSLGWPDKTADLGRYFPTTLLETGSDILFFWVARMVMLSYELCGTAPFRQVLLHGIVRDAHGRKMSKSLGNVIDPLYVIDGITLDEMIARLHTGNLDPREVAVATEGLRKDFPNGIKKCGADALRFTLLNYANGMRDINLDILRVEGYSKLCNKIFNVYNFIKLRSGLENKENGDNKDNRDNLIKENSLKDNKDNRDNLIKENTLKDNRDDKDNSLKDNKDNSNKDNSNKDNSNKDNSNKDNSNKDNSNKAESEYLVKFLDNLHVYKKSDDFNYLQCSFNSLDEFLGEINNISLLEHQKWILDKLNRLIEAQHENFSQYNFMVATQKAHEFFLYQFCDIFLEITKKNYKNDILVLHYVFAAILIVFNPFMPFITEDIFSKLYNSIISSKLNYPKIIHTDLTNNFDDIVTLGKLARTKKIVIEKNIYSQYIDVISQGKATFVDSLGDSIDISELNPCFKYKVLN